MHNKNFIETEAIFVSNAIREGRIEELLGLLDHPSSEGVVEVALDALLSPEGDEDLALAAIRDYVRG